MLEVTHLTQQLGELGGVLGLFKSVSLIGLGDLGIALTLGHTAHGQVHADLAALAVKVGAQILDDVGGSAFGHAHYMLVSENQTLGGLLVELRGGSATDRALLGRGVALVYVTTNGADKFFHS